jgi:bisanhydrobacterioruberin hydratase
MPTRSISKLDIFYAVFGVCAAFSLAYIPEASHSSFGSLVAIVCISFPMIRGLFLSYRWKGLLCVYAPLVILGLGIEYLGLVTGFPYGYFSYGSNLGYKIFDILPYTVGFSWAPLVIGAYVLSARVFSLRWKRILSSVLILLCFDGLLDPVAVDRMFWTYAHGGAYYGVPLSNFLGWILSGFLGVWIVSFFFSKHRILDDTGLIYSLQVSVYLWTILGVLRGLVVPACFGIFLVVLFSVVHYMYAKKTFLH